jgi:hypothetical protein
VGTLDPVLGRSYVQIAREGWGQQKSQNGGANPTLSGPAARAIISGRLRQRQPPKPGAITANDDLFHNSKVMIDTSSPAFRLLGPNPPALAYAGLHKIDLSLAQFHRTERRGQSGLSALRS